LADVDCSLSLLVSLTRKPLKEVVGSSSESCSVFSVTELISERAHRDAARLTRTLLGVLRHAVVLLTSQHA